MKMSKQLVILGSLLLVLVLGLTACKTRPAAVSVLPTVVSVLPTATPPVSCLMKAPTAGPIPAPTYTPRSTLVPVPTPTRNPACFAPVLGIPVLAPQCEFGPEAMTGEVQDFHDLIVFTSWHMFPFPNLEIGHSYDNEGNIEWLSGPQLWAISPDGQRAGRLADLTCSPTAHPLDPFSKSLYTEYLNHLVSFTNQAYPIELPQECQTVWFDECRPMTCSGFAYSPDGRYLGFYSGQDVCGRDISILDSRTGETVYRSEGGGHGFEFLTNGKILISRGHCEGGTTSLFDPETQTTLWHHTAGFSLWNAEHTALAVNVSPYQGVAGAVWGYNVESDTLFLEEPQNWNQQLDNHTLWTTDGSHLLYQHRAVGFDPSDHAYVFSNARQIILIDTASGEKRVLASDPQFDYHLCAGAYSDCDEWHGDWIQVRRFPFKPQTIPYTDDFYHNPTVQCLLYGMGCAEPAKLFALNWRTGELLSWNESVLPTPAAESTPTLIPPAPDLARIPVYTHASGRYAFYAGNDDRSLWLVPSDGVPVQWVQAGSGFVYVP